MTELCRAQRVMRDLMLALVASCGEISFTKSLSRTFPLDGGLLGTEGTSYATRDCDLVVLEWIVRYARLLLPKRDLRGSRLIAFRVWVNKLRLPDV